MDTELEGYDTLAILAELRERHAVRDKADGDVTVRDVMAALGCYDTRAREVIAEEVAAGRLVAAGKVRATNGRVVSAWRRP